VTCVTMDAQENIYAVGQFSGQKAFGTKVLSAATNGLDAFISKLDRNGNWLWARQITQTATNTPAVRIECAAVDSFGGLIVTGEIPQPSPGPTLFGTNSVNVAYTEIFVAKYSSNGDCLWARGTGGFDPTYTHGVALDGSGNIYVSGIWSATNQFIALKLDPDGNELLRLQATSGTVLGRAIRTDAAGNIYVCGALDPPTQIQSTTFTNFNSREPFVLKFDSTGSLVWAQEGGRKTAAFSYDSTVYPWALDLALDSKSNVLVCGKVFSTNLFGISVLNTNYNTNASLQPWLLKLSNDGNIAWLKTIPVVHPGVFTPDPAAYGLGVDAADAAYIFGTFGGTAHFDSTALASLGNNNLFLANYDSAGIFQWATMDGTTNNNFSTDYDHASRMAVGATGLVIGGRVPATGSFGSITFTNPPGWEMFVARIDFPPPSVGIKAIGTNVHLCWPMVPSGYALESTTNLASETIWQTEGFQPTNANGTNYLALPNSSPEQFFRLHRP